MLHIYILVKRFIISLTISYYYCLSDPILLYNDHFQCFPTHRIRILQTHVLNTKRFAHSASGLERIGQSVRMCVCVGTYIVGVNGVVFRESCLLSQHRSTISEGLLSISSTSSSSPPPLSRHSHCNNKRTVIHISHKPPPPHTHTQHVIRGRWRLINQVGIQMCVCVTFHKKKKK